jgi:hypothetical protein
MNKLSGMLMCVLVAGGLAVAQEKAKVSADQGVKVEKAVAAMSVEDREPTGENKEFEASVGTVYCWSKIAAPTVPVTIKHVWYAGDQKLFEKALDIKFSSTRTWSSKSVKSGSWRVDVTDEAGAVLSSVSFMVK